MGIQVTSEEALMKPLLLAGLLVFVETTNASAQNVNVADQTQLVQTLISRIDQLEKRVAELESEKVRPAAAAGLPATAESMQMATLGDSSAAHPSLDIAGFSDFTFSATDQSGVRSGFSAGQFILHLNSKLSSKVSFMGEMSLTARADAGTGSPAAAGFNAEVERSIIRFEHNDRFKVSFGRYHTPINYWNTAFHHGQWLQTTVSRPEMTQFGGKFIPVHFLGALVEGATPAGGMNFNYNVGVGNGRGSVISRGGDAGDNNNARAWLVNMFVRPDRFYGLQVGGSAYLDRVTTGGQEYREWITSTHFVWSRETPEIIAEFANVRHENLTVSAPQTNSQAYYIQAAYRLPFLDKRWKPYYRFDYIHVPSSDTMFQPISNLAGSTTGIRYDITNFAAIKFEYRNQRRAPGQPRINGGFIQTSFAF
jgi:hypothetical protein